MSFEYQCALKAYEAFKAHGQLDQAKACLNQLKALAGPRVDLRAWIRDQEHELDFARLQLPLLR